MASMQRGLGLNAVGYYGLLQAFADALKSLLKEYVAPAQAIIILFITRDYFWQILPIAEYGSPPIYYLALCTT